MKWYLAGCGLVVLGRSWLGVVCGGGVLCENCIVDANAIIINGNGNNDYCCCCLFFFFVVFVLGIFCCLCVIDVLCFLFEGARWMPGYAKPMKDVIGCVKPRGVA